MHDIVTIAPSLSGLARWSAAPSINAGYYFCRDLGRGRRILQSRTFFAPVPRRIEPCPVPHLFGHFSTRTGILPLPKWGNSTVRFSRLPPWKYPRRDPERLFNVSDASVVRSRFRAECVATAPRPAETKPTWTKPAEKPVDFEKQFIWVLYDHDLQDLDRLDKTEIPKELRGVRSIASRQRGYTAEENYIVKVGLDGQFSKDKRDELEPPGAETRDERHALDLWPSFTEQVGESKYDLKVRPLTLQELVSGFATMTTLSLQLSRAANKEVRKIIDAKTASGRAYQATVIILRLYRFGMRDRAIPNRYLLDARTVYQAVSIELLARDYEKRIALGEKGRLSTAPDLLSVVQFMLAPGNSSYDAAVKFDRQDASNFRDQLNDALAVIETKYGRFCKDIGWTPQTRARADYNRGIKDRESAPPILDHEAEAARYRRAEAVAYLEGEERLRDAYRALAEHFERGGHIFYGHTAHDVAPGLYDGRSGKQVLKEAGVVEPEERFPSAKAKRPRPNIEYGVDVGLRHGLADAVAGTEDDDAPIRDTRESSSAVLMRELSPFLTNNVTVHTDDDEDLT